MEERVQAIETVISTLATELKTLSNAVSTGFTKVNGNFESVSRSLKHVHDQMEQLTKKVNSLKGDTNDGFQDVGMKLETLTEEIAKIGTVTNYVEHYSNLKAIK